MYPDLSHYQQLSDDEILNLARDESSLTNEAREALASELSRRNITTDDIQTYTVETRALEDTQNRELQKLLAPRPYGNKKFLGRRNFVGDATSGYEEYDATLWFVVFLFPLIPLGTYRLRRDRTHKRWWNFFDPDIEVLAKLPLDWEQILLTWVIAMSVLFAAILVLPHILPLLVRLVDRLNRRS